MQTVYVQDVWMGEVAWFTTAYFVDPLVICNGGRSSFWSAFEISCEILSMEFWECQWNCGTYDNKDVSGVQATGTTTGQEIVFWSRMELWITSSASHSPRLRRIWPLIGEYTWWWKLSTAWNLPISDQLLVGFFKCWFLGMITSASLAWEITTFSSTTPLNRSNSSPHASSKTHPLLLNRNSWSWNTLIPMKRS